MPGILQERARDAVPVAVLTDDASVPQKCDTLTESLCGLDKALAELITKLRPVLLPEGPEQALVNEISKREWSPIGTSLTSMQCKVRALTIVVDSIAQRVDL